jgi:hypothetical protein
MNRVRSSQFGITSSNCNGRKYRYIKNIPRAVTHIVDIVVILEVPLLGLYGCRGQGGVLSGTVQLGNKLHRHPQA